MVAGVRSFLFFYLLDAEGAIRAALRGGARREGQLKVCFALQVSSRGGIARSAWTPSCGVILPSRMALTPKRIGYLAAARVA